MKKGKEKGREEGRMTGWLIFKPPNIPKCRISGMGCCCSNDWRLSSGGRHSCYHSRRDGIRGGHRWTRLPREEKNIFHWKQKQNTVCPKHCKYNLKTGPRNKGVYVQMKINSHHYDYRVLFSDRLLEGQEPELSPKIQCWLESTQDPPFPIRPDSKFCPTISTDWNLALQL